MHSRQGDNSSSKMYPVVHAKLKHLTCTNCKHAFPFRGAHQFRGKLPLLLECGHAICEACVKTCPDKTCGNCGIVRHQNFNEQGTILVNLYLFGLINATQFVVNSTEPNIEFQQPNAARFRKSVTEDIENCSECGLKAEFRCRQCDVFFCNTCYAKIHGRALQSHQKISLTEDASDIYNFLITKCETHPPEPIQFHCTQCDVPTCTHCLLVSHQNHCIVTQSQKIAETKPQIEDTIERLAETLQRVKLAEKKLAKPLIHIDALHDREVEREQIEARLTQHFTYLHGVLQNIENRFINQLQEQRNLMGNNVNALAEQLKEQKNDLENNILLATSALKSDSAVNITALMAKWEETLSMPCHLVCNSSSEKKIELDIDESIVDSLEEHCSIRLPEISSYSLVRTEELPDDYEIEPIIREEIPRPVLPAIKPAQLPLSKSSLSMSMISLRSTTIDHRQNDSSLVEGSSEAVKITHIKDPSCFYTQSCCDSGILLQLHKALAKQAATSAVPTELVLNKMYLVQYGNDMKWYRGRVQTLYTDVKKGQTCDIFYVDYGNTECSVPIKKMRNMSLQSSLVPIMARRCTLYDIVPKDGHWILDANKIMYEMIEGISHTIMHVFKVYNDIFHVDIMKNSAGDGDYTLSVRDALIFLEYGCFITNEKLRKTNHQSLRKFFEEEVAIENLYDVRATHIESPDCIYVQKIGGGMTHLVKLTADLTEEYGRITTNRGIIYTPQIGMPCAALYNDGKWYRGRISNLLGNRKVEVFFVDFGDKRVYEYDEIRRLHYKFLSITALAFRVSLKDVAPLKNNEWSLQTKEFMNENLMSTFLKIFVFSKESDCYKVTLYIPKENREINFNALLVNENFALSTGSSSQFINIPKTVSKKRKRVFKPKKLAKHEQSVEAEDSENEADDSDPFRMQVNILQAVSPDCIFVSDVQTTKVIKKMAEEIQDFYNKYKSAENEDWEKDDLCIAYSAKDKSYHRAKIVEIITPEKAVVFLYDIGITETVTVQDLQSLHPKFSTLPARAFKVTLAGILPCGGSTTWLSSSCEVLSDLIIENQHSRFYISKAAGIKNDAMSVDLWVRQTRTEGPLAPTIVEINSINKKLVKKGVALPVRGYKDETDKVLTVELRQQLLQSEEKSLSTEVEWVIKNEVPICPLDMTIAPTPMGSSIEMSEPDSGSEDENANGEADVESDEILSLPPPLSAWIPPVPIIDDRFCAVSTNVDQDCVIYLYSLKQNGDILSLLDTALQTHFSGSEPEACDMEWAPNDLCIAQYHGDKKWYRAQVLEVLENDEIKVIFVDYGNVDECKLGTLRKRVIMGHIPIQTTKCVVQGLIPDTPDSKWTVPQLDTIHALLVDKRSDVTVLQRNPDHLVVSMTLKSFKNMDLVMYLQYILNFKICGNGMEMLDREVSHNANSELDSLDNADVVVEESIENYMPETIAKPTLFNLGLTLGSTSPDSKKAENSNNTVTSLMDISDNQILVLDSDVSGEMSLNSVSIMGSDDAEHLTLYGIGSYDRPVDISSTPNNEDDYDFMPQYTCIDIPDDVQIINLEPIFIVEPVVFYARPTGCSQVELLDMWEKQFTVIEEHMHLEAYNPPQLINIRLNSPCCTRYTLDNKWYRAVITEIDSESEKVRVQYVDYGNAEYHSKDKIHSLPEAWLDVPMMSLKCRLSGVRVNPGKPTWKTQIEKFEKVFYQGVRKARIKGRYNGILDVELYSDENCTKLLYDFLLEDGLLEIVEE